MIYYLLFWVQGSWRNELSSVYLSFSFMIFSKYGAVAHRGMFSIQSCSMCCFIDMRSPFPSFIHFVYYGQLSLIIGNIYTGSKMVSASNLKSFV